MDVVKISASLSDLTERVDTLEKLGANERLLFLEDAHIQVKKELERNTQTTNDIKQDTAVLVEFAQAYQATTYVGKALGKILVWLSLVIGGFAAAWAAWKSSGK